MKYSTMILLFPMGSAAESEAFEKYLNEGWELLAVCRYDSPHRAAPNEALSYWRKPL